MKKEKKKVVKQAKGPMAKKVRKMVVKMSLEKDWIQEVEVVKKKREVKECDNMGIDRHPLKIEKSSLYEWC